MAQDNEDFNQLINNDKLSSITVWEKLKEDVSDDETSSSGVYSDYSTYSATTDKQYSIMNSDPAAQLFEETMLSLEKNSLMKVYESSHFTKEAINLYKKNEVIQNKWNNMIDYYKNNLKCNDYNRIKFQFGKCINTIMNDERKIMLGLDSTEVVKDVLITCMRMCSDPKFKLEIRVGLGGTEKPLTARTPSYAIAGIALLYRLLDLATYFSLNRESDQVQTTMLQNPPLLIFYSAHTAAVTANKINEITAKKTANDILLYIQGYINKFHPNLVPYVRYGMDHSMTYDPLLLDRISGLFISNCHDSTLRTAFAAQANTHNSTEEAATKYVSTHSIGFRDIIDKQNSHLLFTPIKQNKRIVQSDQEISLPDCIISIGGSVEIRFGQARQIIRQAFRESLQNNDKDRYHLPLSIRMLSKAGEVPVYYHHRKYEITFSDILNSNTIDLYQNKDIPRAVKEDLLILTNDIGITVLKSMLEAIAQNKLLNDFSLEKPISTLTDLCWEILEEHAKNEDRTCQCAKTTNERVDQFFEHYNISNYLNYDTRSIISCIINCFDVQKQKQNKKQTKKQKKAQSHIQFVSGNVRARSDTLPSPKSEIEDIRPRSGTTPSIDDPHLHSDTASSTQSEPDYPHLHSDTVSSTQSEPDDLRSRSDSQCIARETIYNINQQCDSIFGRIFVAFIKTFGKNNDQEEMNNGKSI